MKDRLYRIGEIAKKAGVTPRTVRYYEDLGLLKTKNRTDGGQRVYTVMDLIYLLRIMQLKGYGLSLQDISKIIKLGYEDSTGEKRRFELMAQYQNLISRELEIIRNHQNLVKQLKWSLAQLQNSKDAFRDCPGSACEDCEIHDTCMIRKVVES